MAVCSMCGNDYEDAFAVITRDGRSLTFDCFECAIHELAPTCAHCGCRVIGHGVEVNRVVYCCGHCAREGAGRGEASIGIGE